MRERELSAEDKARESDRNIKAFLSRTGSMTAGGYITACGERSAPARDSRQNRNQNRNQSGERSSDMCLREDRHDRTHAERGARRCDSVGLGMIRAHDEPRGLEPLQR